MDDLYFEFADDARPDFAVGKVVDVENIVPLGGSRLSKMRVTVTSRRDFPNSADFFGIAEYDGVEYAAQVSLNAHLREGDGIVLSPMPEVRASCVLR